MTQFPNDPNTAGAPTWPPQFGGPLPPPLRNSKLAIASFVLGILSFCSGGLLGLIGLPLGIAALVSIGKRPTQMGGKGFAIAGISVSVCGFFFGCFSMGLFLPALAKARQSAQATKASATLTMLGHYHSVYVADHDGALPPTNDWINAISSYAPNINDLAESPMAAGDGRAYAMNAKLNGLKFAQVRRPERTVMLFEIPQGGPMSGGPDDMGPRPRTQKGYLVCYVDGHVEFVPASQASQLAWDP